MAYEMKEGQGSLFKNEKQNDRQPDFKGRIMIGGTVYDVAGWQRMSQNGKEYISLQAALPRERTDAPAQQYQAPAQQSQAPAPQYQAPAPSASDYMDTVVDDLPF